MGRRYFAVTILAVSLILCLSVASPPQPRWVRVRDRQFVNASTNATIVLAGPNVVVKGPPYLPRVSGDTVCTDSPLPRPAALGPGPGCEESGTCTSCTTFNQRDIDNIKSRGWNFIRLGVIWAGAQPRDEDALDPDFLERLHAVLNLTDRNGINVMLDNHGDMTSSLGCGNGAPAWVSKKAAPGLVGKPLESSFPYSLVVDVKKTKGYDHCGGNATKWAAHAGDPNYNILNECCEALNYDSNPVNLGFSTINVATMDYMIRPGPGRSEFVRFWRLVAEAAAGHPSAFAAELMNEPMSIRRGWMYDTWREAAGAILAVVPDMSVSVADLGEGGNFVPAWATKLGVIDVEIAKDTLAWIKASQNLFYAWHYGDASKNLKNVNVISQEWNLPTFATEVEGSNWDMCGANNISHSYWHYSSYCNTGRAFENTTQHNTFGACILGFGAGNSTGPWRG